ncbi:MAG: cyclase family protein [bacterium]
MIYDITLPISSELAVWPGDNQIKYEKTLGDIQVSCWTIGSHNGTHIDAPKHVKEFSESIDDIPLEWMNGKCRVIEINAEKEISVDDLVKFDIIAGERLLIKTSNSASFMANPTKFPDHFIGLNPSAAEYLASKKIQLIGIDFLSIEAPGYNMLVHRLLLSQKIVILEGLDLRKVTTGEYNLICAPLKLSGSDGAPARVYLNSNVE